MPAGTDVATIDKVFDTFASYYKEHSAIKTRPYDGIRDAIAKLRAAGVKTAVVSNKADFAVQICVLTISRECLILHLVRSLA